MLFLATSQVRLTLLPLLEDVGGAGGGGVVMGRSQVLLGLLEAGGVGNRLTGLGTGETTGAVILTLTWALAAAATITKKLSKAKIFFMIVVFAMKNAISSPKIERAASEKKGSAAATPTKRPNDKQHPTGMRFSPHTTVSPDEGRLCIKAVVRRKTPSLVGIIRRWTAHDQTANPPSSACLTSRASPTGESGFF